PVRPDRVRKSIGSENTFFHDLFSHDDLAAARGKAVHGEIYFIHGFAEYSRNLHFQIPLVY
ncbi:MAG: hypothetical protein DI586_08160, partial [Micavibrio aeruginosavorus]